ncbi:Uncharacterised protein [BD1-7 clade bacterium]|uniref:Cyclic nucleotide-binding domain-containing protein n=1 Tax=BD1-7 clade bacterium TaxID=2029982 RepID=A0A5S9Q7M8_9GAMM|nr:Uncharacterised protein [BD1-7 clade bacterium]CAA0113932.1 Uncharacterised protein [BD1-7 clade bacterium]
MIDEIKKVLLNLVPSTPDYVFDHLQGSMTLRNFSAGEYLCWPESACANDDSAQHYHYIKKGLLRCYYQRPDGKEFNTRFVHEGQLFANVLASAEGECAELYVQALEPVTAVQLMSVADLRKQSETDIYFARFIMRCMRSAYIDRENRQYMLQSASAVERYSYIRDAFPQQLLARIPQYHLASYLGLNSITFSRAKKAFLTQQNSQPVASNFAFASI